MNLAGYVKCLKNYALNKRISDEDFLNAVLLPYIIAGRVDNKNKEEIYFDKSRTSLILNRHVDVPGALRQALNSPNIYQRTEENYEGFIKEYMNPSGMSAAVEEISEMIESDQFSSCKSMLISKKSDITVFLADTLIECIKLKNDGFDPEGEIIRNGAYCIKVVYKDIFRYAFRKRSKEKNIVVIPVDNGFHTHVTRKYETKCLNEVSASSIHGQFLTRWEQSGGDIGSLSQRIKDNLQDIVCDNGKYPIGTIATIENDSTVFYLMAISEFDQNNNAHSCREEIIHCIDKLSIFYDRYGDGHNIYIPLMGTGKSRADVSLQESYDILVGCYKKNRTRIQGNIFIVIHKDLEKHVDTGKGGN